MADRPVRKERRVIRSRVVRTEWLTAHLIRVTVGGGDVAAFDNNAFTDRYVKLVFPRPGVEYPEPFEIGRIRAELPREQWPVTRTYTVRSYDPTTAELAINFVHHGEEGLAGPWAAGAKPGDELLLLGPGGAYAPSPDAAWHLMVGDESALPAIASALEELPAGVPVEAFVEVSGPDEEIPLRTRGSLTLRWFHRDGSAAEPGRELVDAVRTAEFRPGPVHAFVHGEAGFVRELRTHLRHDRQLPTELLSISGYWRRGKNEDGWQAEKAEEARREREAAGATS